MSPRLRLFLELGPLAAWVLLFLHYRRTGCLQYAGYPPACNEAIPYVIFGIGALCVASPIVYLVRSYRARRGTRQQK